MATIANLHKSISKMEPDECLNRIRDLRAARRINKGKIYIRTQKKAKTTKAKAVESPLAVLDRLKKSDPSALLKLIEEMENA